MSDDRTSAHPEILDRWLARAAIAVVVALQFSLINDFGYGSRRLAPIAELILLIPITAIGLRAERVARYAHDQDQWASASAYRGVAFALGVTLFIVVSLANSRSLLLLIEALLAGKTHNGRTLLLDALNIWATNVVVFSLWYWGLDRGGPGLVHPGVR